MLLITDLRSPGGDDRDPRLGLAAAGFTFDTADYGSGAGGVLNLHHVDFENYDVVVVASDLGGWLRQDELDVLNARAVDIMSYINNGGGLVALNESGSRIPGPGIYPGTDHARYNFVSPSLASGALNQFEIGFRVTPYGQEAGFTEADVNGNYSHSYFTHYIGLDVVDTDGQGRPISLAVRGRQVLFSISGHVMEGSAPVPGLPITVAPSGTATTDASGHYTVTNLLAGNYTVTPFSQCYSFSPPVTFTTLPPSAADQDFQAIPPNSQSCLWLLGPQRGTVPYTATFTAGLNITVTVPITYIWRATGQAEVSHVAGKTDSITYTWASPGPKTIAVTTFGLNGPASANGEILLFTRSYLPYVSRQR